MFICETKIDLFFHWQIQTLLLLVSYFCLIGMPRMKKADLTIIFCCIWKDLIKMQQQQNGKKWKRKKTFAATIRNIIFQFLIIQTAVYIAERFVIL